MLHREDEKTTLSIAALPTFASHWLIPRLMRFQQEHAQFQLKIKALEGNALADPDTVDIMLHYGGDHWPRAVSHLLLSEEVVPVCAKSLLATGAKSSRKTRLAKDIVTFPLLHLSSRINAWPDWMAAQEIDCGMFAGTSFEHFHMLLEAAKMGMGVALMPTIMVQEALQSGALIAPFGQPMATANEYFLSYPADKADREQVVTFRDWLLANIDIQ
jgi:LysR family transcriptional regulator, glycine cleavage system transcriptional activator